jgi:hypothetical protein
MLNAGANPTPFSPCNDTLEHPRLIENLTALSGRVLARSQKAKFRRTESNLLLSRAFTLGRKQSPVSRPVGGEDSKLLSPPLILNTRLWLVL